MNSTPASILFGTVIRLALLAILIFIFGDQMFGVAERLWSLGVNEFALPRLAFDAYVGCSIVCVGFSIWCQSWAPMLFLLGLPAGLFNAGISVAGRVELTNMPLYLYESTLDIVRWAGVVALPIVGCVYGLVLSMNKKDREHVSGHRGFMHDSVPPSKREV